MPTANYAGVNVALNDEGFMVDASQWSPAVGEAIATNIGLALTPVHWQVINFVREDYANTGKSPGLRRITSNTKVATKELYKLFPRGPGKLVARIARTPTPKSCL